MRIHNLLECSSNCFYTTGSLWLKIKQLILFLILLKVMLLSRLSVRLNIGKHSSIWSKWNLKKQNNCSVIKVFKSLEMLLINWKAELKLKWTNYCALSADAKSKIVIFTIKNAKLYFPVFTLSAKYHQNLLKPLSKGFRRSVCWNYYKTKKWE